RLDVDPREVELHPRQDRDLLVRVGDVDADDVVLVRIRGLSRSEARCAEAGQCEKAARESTHQNLPLSGMEAPVAANGGPRYTGGCGPGQGKPGHPWVAR